MLTISIVVPLYNLAGTLTRAVESILAQDYADWECIIVDDGSTDSGGALADRLAKRDGRIHVLHQDNAGLSNAMNAGFRRAVGQEFVILSADDAYAPQFLRRMHDAMQQSRADVVSCDMHAGDQLVQCQKASTEALRKGNCHHYAALFKRWVFEKTGGFKPAMNPSWEDYEFWVSCAEAGAIWSHLPEPLFIYYPSMTGRNAEAEGKERLLQGKMAGYHPRTFGIGKGLVAVVIPCYRHEEYIHNAVNSVLAQTYPHKRAVVVDDASPSWKSARLNGSDCHVLHHKDNRGLSAARNTGLTWAQREWQAEYWIALDADDELHPEFIERTMAVMDDRQWAYTDVQFIGDAWHKFDLKAWDCMRIGSKHQNPCTFLAPMRMYRDVWQHRGYGYDESPNLRAGYEDMEFGLACVQQGWEGCHVAGPWFKYRFHKDGSMRTRANKIKSELVRYIATRHLWAYTVEGLRMACRSCGGARNVKIKGNQVEIEHLGAVPLGEPLRVTFTGGGTGKRTKIGVGGRVYRFSSEARSFIIDPRDAFLFESGQFQIERVTRIASPIPLTPYVPPPIAASQPATADELVAFDLGPETMPVEKAKDETVAVKTPRDRLMALPHLTQPHVAALWKEGYRSIKAIGAMTIDRLERTTGLSKNEAQEVINHARLHRKSS